jgi:hypothetical protein
VYERTPFEYGDAKVIVAASRRGELRLNFDSTVYASFAECDVTGEYVLGENSAEYFICKTDVNFTCDNIK